MIAIPFLLLAMQRSLTPSDLQEVVLRYARAHTVGGPFHNKWITPASGGGVGLERGKNPWHYSFTVNMSDGSHASATVDRALSEASELYSCDSRIEWADCTRASFPQNLREDIDRRALTFQFGSLSFLDCDRFQKGFQNGLHVRQEPHVVYCANGMGSGAPYWTCIACPSPNPGNFQQCLSPGNPDKPYPTLQCTVIVCP